MVGMDPWTKRILGIYRPSEGSPHPPSRAPRAPRASCAPARRATQSQGDCEGHGKPKPPRFSDERHTDKLGVPRERRLMRFLWLVIFLTSPGSKARTDTAVACPINTGTFAKAWPTCIAPGELPHLDVLQVPYQPCLEHACRCPTACATASRQA